MTRIWGSRVEAEVGMTYMIVALVLAIFLGVGWFVNPEAFAGKESLPPGTTHHKILTFWDGQTMELVNFQDPPDSETGEPGKVFPDVPMAGDVMYFAGGRLPEGYYRVVKEFRGPASRWSRFWLIQQGIIADLRLHLEPITGRIGMEDF